MGLSNWWYYTGSATKAITIIGIVAIALLVVVVASPHVKPLQPVGKALGLVQVKTQVQTIYVPVNHTVYVNQTIVKVVNQTVPIYINRTVYVYVGNSSLAALEAVAGRCAGDLVILPNNTAWFVFVWLIPRDYLMNNPILYRDFVTTAYTVYYNSTTHYAQLTTGGLHFFFYGLAPEQMGLFTYGFCYLDNVTINGYYAAVCGDTIGAGPVAIQAGEFPPAELININGVYYQKYTLIAVGDSPVFAGSQIILSNRTYSNVTLVIPQVNTTYTGIMIYHSGIAMDGTFYPIDTLGPTCNITVVYAPNPQAALYITLPQDYIKYWEEADISVWGRYNPYDVYMGYYVWSVGWQPLNETNS